MNWRGFVRRHQPAWLGISHQLRPLTPRGDHRSTRTGVGRTSIDRFMDSHRADFVGPALEVREAHYCARYPERLTSVDIIDIDPDLPGATIVADLCDTGAVESDAFEVAVILQTLQYIFEGRRAVDELHRVLAPGGVLLLTVTSCEQISGCTKGSRPTTGYTCRAVDELLTPFAHREVASFGNCLAAMAKLRGVPASRLGRRLWVNDPAFPIIVAARAEKDGVRGAGEGWPPAMAGNRFDPAPPPK